MKAIITGTPLADRYVTALKRMSIEVVNGSKKLLDSLGFNEAESERELTESEIEQVIGDAEIYIYGGLEPASDRILSAAKSLRLICFLGTGWSDPGCVDEKAARNKGLYVTNTAHANAASVAEAAMGLLVALERGFFGMNSATKQGGWSPVRRRDVAGKQLGIVGMGAIGHRVAQHATLGFNMKVVYSGPHRKPDIEERLGIAWQDLDELFRTSDFVSIHSPGHSTTGIVGRDQISNSKDDLVLINLSAPEIVDGQALLDALSAGKIRVAMDGIYSDPVLKDKFLALPDDRFVVLPRSAWLTDDSYNRMADMVIESLCDYQERKTLLRHQVLP